MPGKWRFNLISNLRNTYSNTIGASEKLATDIELKDLGDPTFQLTAGVSLVFTDDFYLDLSVAEDIRTLTAADMAFQLALVAAF